MKGCYEVLPVQPDVGLDIWRIGYSCIVVLDAHHISRNIRAFKKAVEAVMILER